MKFFSVLASLAVLALASDGAAANNVTDVKAPVERELAVGMVMAGFQVAEAAIPIVTAIIDGTKKECQQVWCTVKSKSRTCAIAVAEQVQNTMTMGRDRYRYEEIYDGGMRLRFWRTKYEPVDRGDVASGTCTNGSPFTVTDCQSDGKVKC